MADVLKVKDFVRVRLTRNGINLVDQAFNSDEDDFTEMAADRAVLATSMATSQSLNLGGVGTAARIMLETDKSILIGLGVTPANKWTLADDGVLIMTGSFSHVWVRNTGREPSGPSAK